MHTIKFKGCLAQQDNKTLAVTVSKAGLPQVTYKCGERLSRKELRTAVGKYLNSYGSV